MRALCAVLLCCLISAPTAAEWPTTSYIPIPAGEPPYDDLNNPEDLTVENVDRSVLTQGAFGVLSDLMALAKRDSIKLEAAGFKSPLIQPLVIDESTGDKYFPIRWKGGFSAPAQQGCVVARNGFGMITNVLFTLEMNTASFPYPEIARGYNAGGARRNNVLDRMSATITHEVVHGIQNRNWKNPETCEFIGLPEGSEGPLWFSEGSADGIAHYLLYSRRPGAAESYGPGRNHRRWDEGLNATGMSIGNNYTYETGSFFRYLMEASESAPGDGLPIMKDVLDIAPSKLMSGGTLISHLDASVKKHAGGRGLYQVLPEFFTEYGSYGVGRYQMDLFSGPGRSMMLTHEVWLDKSFGSCVEFELTPGKTVSQKVRVDALAAECIHVKWWGFSTPVAMQVYGDGKNQEYGDLHLGEAVRKDIEGTKYCYTATKGLKPRLKLKMTRKCMMRRETNDVGKKAAPPGKVAIWTSDFNMTGDGEVYFILSNVALDPKDTEEIGIDFMIGAVDVKSEGSGNDVKPKKPAPGKATQNGKTDVDKRVHAMSGNEKRMLLDGRTVFGESMGLGFMEGLQGQGTIGKGVLGMVRGGNYWIGFVASKKGGRKDSAFVIKEPSMFESSGYLGAVMGGGRVHGSGNQQCGYKIEADISLIEQSRLQMKYRIVVDMFDMSRGMSSMSFGGSQCDTMRSMHVERADFEVTLPFGTLYDGSSTVQKANPPGQDLYDNVEFLTGPNLGGIETSLQLAGVSETDQNGSDNTPPDQSAPDSSLNHLRGKCACGCPDVARPDTAPCRQLCERVWKTCKK